MVRFLSALLLSTLLAGSSAFQVHRPRATRPSTTELFVVDTSPMAARDYNGFVEWGNAYGLMQENFQISEQYDGWGVVAAQAAQAGSRSLYVPSIFRLASARIRQEEFAAFEPLISQYIDATNSNGNINLACHFYLFLKVLQEYELGDQSSYRPWLNALPRTFTTALNFNDVEMQCLPPYVGHLAKMDRHNFELFLEVLQQLQIPTISDYTKNNLEVTKWAFNVVFTRARAAFGEAEIIPMADMFNHAADPNVEVQYDGEANVHVTFLKDVQPGEAMYKCYGQHTNPSRFLATYGFFDTSPPATYCKLMAGKTLTPELVNLGFVHEKMVFYVENGAIADPVWDVMLYITLEKTDQAAKRQFYDAHMRGDEQTKANLHQMYRAETTTGLLEHVDAMLSELASRDALIQQQSGLQHPHLPMIKQHNDFVRETFMKVRYGLAQIAETSGADQQRLMVM